MKKLFLILSLFLSGPALAQPTTTKVPLTVVDVQSANTIVGNATSGSASPTALSIGGCSSASSALIWTTNTGFGCNTSITAATLSATLTVPNGGTGATTFTSNAPLIGAGAGAITVGTKSGNTTTFATATGTLTNGHCVSIDASGNFIDAGGACTTGGGGGTVSSGTINQLAYYAATGTVVSGLATANNGVLITSGGGAPSISSTLPSAVQGNITSTGTIASGTWNGSVIGGTYGGTGVNNGASTITLGGNLTTSGAFPVTFTSTASTSVTLPTSGTLVNSAVTTLSSLTSVGTIGTGTWQGTVVGATYGGTGVNNGSNTLTLAANTTFAGAFSTTITSTAGTNSTLPSGTHTLAGIDAAQTWTATQTFGSVVGTVTTQSGTTYTLASTDCGTLVRGSNASAITFTIPATLPIGCNIAIEQALAGQISVNGSAVTPATLHSAHSYTKTSAQWAIIGISIETNSGGSAAVAILTGDGA